MEQSLTLKTQAYFKAFAARDEAAIATMFASDASLQDPIVGLVSGHENVMEVYRGIFSGHQSIECKLARTYWRTENSIAVEFSLKLVSSDGSEAFVDGVDCIEFKDGKISSLRAYLDTSESAGGSHA